MPQNKVPDILFVRKEDGSLVFPRLDQISLRRLPDTPADADDIPKVQADLLETVLIRSSEPSVGPIKHLRLSRNLVQDPQYKSNLEAHIPLLVLTETW